MKRSVAVTAFALAVMAGGNVHAQGAPRSPALRESLSDEAGAKFDEGSRLYRASEFAPAREAFLAAHAKSGDRRILYNVAVCDKSLGRYARAIAMLRTSLVSTDRPLPADYTQRVSETIATLSRYVAFATLDSPVPGVSFSVDGEEVRENPVALDTGSHSVSASKEGYESASKKIDVKAGDTTRVTLPLEPSKEPGRVMLSCQTQSPCDLYIDDEALGRAPVTVTRPTGSYLVRAYVGGRAFGERRVDVTNGTSLAISLLGTPIAMARLRVMTGNAEDQIVVDGQHTGRSGLDLELPPGEHRVTLTRPGGATKTIDVVLRPNETRDYRETLDDHRVSPWWFVGGAAVAVAATAVIVFFATRPTTFEGSTAGTLDPFVIPASRALFFP